MNKTLKKELSTQPSLVLSLALGAFFTFLIILGIFRLADHRRQLQMESQPRYRTENIIREQLSGQTDLGTDRLRGLAVTESDKGLRVVIDFNADGADSTALRRILIEQKMGEIYRQLYESGLDIALVTISAYFPLQEANDSTYDAVVYKTSVGEDVARAINYELPDSVVELVLIPTVWETETLHPAFGLARTQNP